MRRGTAATKETQTTTLLHQTRQAKQRKDGTQENRSADNAIMGMIKLVEPAGMMDSKIRGSTIEKHGDLPAILLLTGNREIHGHNNRIYGTPLFFPDSRIGKAERVSTLNESIEEGVERNNAIADKGKADTDKIGLGAGWLEKDRIDKRGLTNLGKEIPPGSLTIAKKVTRAKTILIEALVEVAQR